MKTKKKLKKNRDEIFTSPDGGETVYCTEEGWYRGRLVVTDTVRKGHGYTEGRG